MTTPDTLDEAVAHGFQALVLGYTADALDADDNAVRDAIVAMTAETQLAIEIVAGILAAGTLLAAMAGITPEALRVAAHALNDTAEADDEPAPLTEG